MAIVKLHTIPSASTAQLANEIRSLGDLRAFIARQGLERAPIDVREVAERLGIAVRLEPMLDDMSGFLERQGQRWIIGVNQFHSPVRQRFTIAHELAHFVLHRTDQTQFRDETFARRSESKDPMERAADSFAAELLMPRESVNSAVAGGVRSLDTLAATYRVSAIAMKYRLKDLGYHVS